METLLGCLMGVSYRHTEKRSMDILGADLCRICGFLSAYDIGRSTSYV